MKKQALPRRCHWAQTEPMIAYHDREWGVPVHDDRTLFEMLCLEGAQAGLSWEIVLRRRERYRELFRNFDPALVARMTPARIEKFCKIPASFAIARKSSRSSPTRRRFSKYAANSVRSTSISGISSMVSRSSTAGTAPKTSRRRPSDPRQ